MTRKLLLITVLTGGSLLLKAQRIDTLTISPIVGSVIDSAEKKQYRILPYYSSQEFIRAVFILNADSNLMLKTHLKPDRVVEKPMTKQEYDWIKSLIQGKSNIPDSSLARQKNNSKMDGIDRKWSFSLFAGFSIMGPGQDIENQMEDSGFGDSSSGGSGWFGNYGGTNYPIHKTSMVWNFETKYNVSEKSAFNITAGKISHSSIEGHDHGNYLTIKSDLLSASLNYVWRIGRGISDFWVGPVIASHKIRVEVPYQYQYNHLQANSSTIKPGFNLGCTLAFLQKKSWFLAIKANYTWLPDAEIGPYTSQQTYLQPSVFEETKISMSTINIGVATGWRF